MVGIFIRKNGKKNTFNKNNFLTLTKLRDNY